MGARRILGQRVAAVGDRRQRFVFDFDKLRGVFGDVAVVGDHAGHRLAGEAHFVLRQHVIQARLFDRRMRHQQRQRVPLQHFGQVGEGDYRMHAGYGERSAFVDIAEPGVRVGAAHEGRVQHAGDLDVVDEAAFAAQQRGVFLAFDGGAEPA